jgi:hypothetical protein
MAYVDGIYRTYLGDKRRWQTKSERDAAVRKLSEIEPFCRIELPDPLVYLDGDYQAIVRIDSVRRTLEIRAVDPKVTHNWLRANAARLVSSRAVLDGPRPGRSELPVDVFMTKKSLAARLYDVTKAKIAEHRIVFDRWLEPAAGDGAFFTLLPEGSLGIDASRA